MKDETIKKISENIWNSIINKLEDYYNAGESYDELLFSKRENINSVITDIIQNHIENIDLYTIIDLNYHVRKSRIVGVFSNLRDAEFASIGTGNATGSKSKINEIVD